MQQPINVTLDNGSSLWFEYFRGVVVEESKRSETEIGSDNIVRHTLNGSYAQTVITSEQVRTHSIWLRTAEGVEREFELPSHGFSIRHGHDVVIGWGGAQGHEEGAYVLAANRSTGSTWHLSLSDHQDQRLHKLFGLMQPQGLFWWGWVKWTLIVSFGAGLICALLFQSLPSFTLPTVAMLCGPGEVIAYIVCGVAWAKRHTQGANLVEQAFALVAKRLSQEHLGPAAAEPGVGAQPAQKVTKQQRA